MEGVRAPQQTEKFYTSPPIPAEKPLTGNFASHSVQKEEVEPYIQDEQRISSDVIELAKFNISTQWEMVATRLGFSEQDKALLKSKHLGENEEEHLCRRETPPGYCPLIEEMIRTAQSEKKLTREAIIKALDQAANLPCISFESAQKASEIYLDCESNPGKKYDSYVFLIWVKHPERPGACPLPNTESCPVQQAGYDWALKNPDKLVVLWFSSSTLNAEQNDKKMIREFQDTIRSSEVSNLLVLDVDDINWGDEARSRGFNDDTKVSIKTFLRPRNPEISFANYIDGLRIVLLSMGSQCIFSASVGKNYSIQRKDIPNRGAYFDVDYYPVAYKSYADPGKPFCRDACLDMPYFNNGQRHLNQEFIPNSMLAICNEQQSFLCKWPLTGCVDRNAHMARCQPYLCSETKTFRMSDLTYDDHGNKIEWNRDSTWVDSFKDKSTNRPLILRERQYSEEKQYPEYLIKYSENPQGKKDPMLLQEH